MRNHRFIIATEGLPWIGASLILTIFLALIGWSFLAWLTGGFTIFITSFFRNPHRHPPEQKGLIISPADGKVCMITNAYEKRFFKEPRKRISIFMSVLNCHVNRSPISANIIDTHYHPGKFHVANVDKASDLNEQHALLMEDENKNRFVLVQIAGFIARRIVSYVKVGDQLKAGDRLGIIQFGSRVDLYLPHHATVTVKQGEKLYAGETVLGMIQ